MTKQSNGRSGFDSAIWGACDNILRRSNCPGTMQHVPRPEVEQIDDSLDLVDADEHHFFWG